MDIGDNMRNIRKRKGMTLQQLADILGCSQQNISQYESGKRTPKLETLQKMAAALEVSLFDLVDKEELINTKSRIKRQIENGTISMLPSSLLDNYSKLNDIGKHEAEKRVEELTEIPRYTQKEDHTLDKEE